MSLSPQASKARLRTALLETRRARSGDALIRARDAICAHVLSRQTAAGWGCVAAYEPLATEPGSVTLLAGLRERGVRVLVPITLPDRDLDWTEWTAPRRGGPLATGEGDLGRAAVGAADAVLAPALAVDLVGNRLGRGGGSYDRALGRVRTGSEVAALLFDDELLPDLPADSWDVPVRAAVTPAGWHELARRNAGGANAR